MYLAEWVEYHLLIGMLDSTRRNQSAENDLWIGVFDSTRSNRSVEYHLLIGNSITVVQQLRLTALWENLADLMRVCALCGLVLLL